MSETTGSKFVYVTFIRTTPGRLWEMLTGPDFIPQFWLGVKCESDFKTGSSWRLIFDDGRVADTGEIVDANPPSRLAIRWRNEFRPELKAEGYSLCTFDLEPARDAVKLTVTHSIDVPKAKFIDAVTGGWPIILSNLKSLLETGQVILKSRP